MTQPPRYHIPTHLNVPDTIDLPLFGITVSLTVRQLICFLFGWGMAFQVWQRSLGLEALLGLLGTLLHWGGPLSLAFLTYVLAKQEVRGRHLEHWALVVFGYFLQPRIFVWCALFDEVRDGQGSEEEGPHKERDEDDKEENNE